MPDSSKLSSEFKDFRFRRRYDHFLRFKLLNAKPNEIIEAARELGFKINAKDLAKIEAKKIAQAAKKAESIQTKSALDRLKSFLKR